MNNFITLQDFEYYNSEIADDSMKEIMVDVSKALTTRGNWEEETEEIMKKEIKEGDIVVDIGASIGYFTLLMSKLVGASGTVYSFEPTPNQFVYLQHNIKQNGFEDRVKVFNIAANDQQGVLSIQCNACSPNLVSGWALDDILPKKVDFIKIDIDGSEPRALKGLIKTIERNPQLKMIIEYIPETQRKLGNSPEEMMEIIDKYFTYKKVDEHNLYCQRK